MISRRRSLLAASDQRLRAARQFPRVSTTALMIATALLMLVLIGVTIAALVITRQPPEQPLQVPSVSSA